MADYRIEDDIAISENAREFTARERYERDHSPRNDYTYKSIKKNNFR